MSRWAVSKSGNYCFKRSGGGGTLVVEVDGLEVARRALPGMGSNQQREDFEIYPNSKDQSATPGSVSAKYFYPPNEKTADLYKKAAEAARAEDRSGVVRILKEITAADPADFVAWGELGSAYFRQNDFQQADAAYRHSLELKVDYSPSWINIGQLRMAQKQYEAAIEILKHAVELEPDSAKAFRLIGESYLQVKKGTLGAEALNTAIKLEPIGMAECHLTLAHLYDLAGAKQMAAAEYKNFLSKVPDHPDKKKFESYIKENGKK
nr:TPR-repeat-containing protein [uncultured bacterium]